jgi:hypothetical protein
MNRAHFVFLVFEDENANPLSSAPRQGHGKGTGTMKRIALIAAVGVLLAQSADCAAGVATQPASQPSKAEAFLLVEVKGTIGKDFSAAKMKAAIAEARTAKAAAIVLSVDTPGGSVPDAEAIVDLIIENKDLRFIALVNKALSAGAAITLACKEIYVMETATIGAAVSYIPDRRGIPGELPADVAEKFQSAWRAVCRKAADCGGHSSLLAEGMADPGFAITKRIENGKVILERDGKGELVKAAGRILTLTAKEAVACGLAKAVVPDVADLGAKLGMRQMGAASGTSAGGPDPFYDLIWDKIGALGLTSSLTELATKAAEKEWDAWFKIEWGKVKDTRVSWVLSLKEAQLSKRGTIAVKCAAPTRNRHTPTNKWFKDIVVTASVRVSDKEVVAAISPGGSITITGRVIAISFEGAKLVPALYDVTDKVIQWYDMGTVQVDRPVRTLRSINIRLADCVVGDAGRVQPAAAPKPPLSSPVDPEAEAKQRLNLANTYVRNGMTAQALKMLRSIVEDFPNTAAAKEAKEQIKQLLEDEAQKAGKGS